MDGVGFVGSAATTLGGSPSAAGDITLAVSGAEAGATIATRFGPVPLDPDRQIRFRGGLPGFPTVETFQLEPLPGLESELLLMQAVDTPEIGFITLPLPADMPILRDPDIKDVSRMLDIDEGELMILAIVTLAAGQAGIDTFVNLRAPLFVDVRRKVGAQVVLGDPSYPLRHRMAAA